MIGSSTSLRFIAGAIHPRRHEFIFNYSYRSFPPLSRAALRDTVDSSDPATPDAECFVVAAYAFRDFPLYTSALSPGVMEKSVLRARNPPAVTTRIS